jgi:cytochrome b
MSTDLATIDRAEPASRQAEATVWDPCVRIFHWGLVAAFLVAWATGDEVKRVHVMAGYAVIGLVASRILWGFVGTRHARFVDFVRGLGSVTSYLRDTARLRAKRYLGHNPAGGAMIMALLIMLSIIGATGYMMTTDAFWGVAWVQGAHETAVSLTLGLVVLHILGVIVAGYEHRENLVRAMITGRKRVETARR